MNLILVDVLFIGATGQKLQEMGVSGEIDIQFVQTVINLDDFSSATPCANPSRTEVRLKSGDDFVINCPFSAFLDVLSMNYGACKMLQLPEGKVE